MALDPTINFGKVTVSTGYDDLATSIVLNGGDGARLPDPATAGAFNLVWWNFTDYPDPSDDPNREIVRCTARSTDTLTVTRGQEGIAASTKNAGGKTYKMILALTAYQMGLVIAQGGNSFGEAVSIGSNDAQVVYLKYNNATAVEINASGVNLYSPRTLYTSGGDMWFGLLSLNNLKINTNNTERMRIRSDGDVNIGATGFAVRFVVVDNDGGGGGTYFASTIAKFQGQDATTNNIVIGVANLNPYIVFIHSTGTAAAPAATGGGNFMGGFQVYGHNGTTYASGGYIQIAASSGVAWSGTNEGTELWIQLTPVNATAQATRFVMKGSGETIITGDGTVISEGAAPMFTVRSTKSAPTDVGTPTNYHLMLLHPVNTNGAGSGLAFSISSDTTNVGASIINYRVSSNSQGRLLFYTKQSITAAVDPVLAMVIDEAGRVVITSTNAVGAARFHIIEPTIGNEVFRIESVATNDDVSEKTHQGRVATTDATVTTILTLATIADSVKSIDVRVVARRTGGIGGTAGDVAGYSRMATFKNIAGTVTQVGATTDDHTAEDQAGWDVTFAISGTNVLVQVTGAADNNITWHATARTYELST